VTRETIERAFHATEEGFASIVSELWQEIPNLATVGTCCLVGVIYQNTLFVASLGDSRVVLGKKGNCGGLSAIQLSTEHNANNEDIRWELKDLHPDDPQIVVFRHGVWRVKGIIQVVSHSPAIPCDVNFPKEKCKISHLDITRFLVVLTLFGFANFDISTLCLFRKS
jgi:hypothetical protein